jgi:anti-sigma factor RsiW
VRVYIFAGRIYIMMAMDAPGEIECRQIAELLGDYLDGTLPRATRELLEWHIEGCPPCVAFVNTYRGTVNAARKLADMPVPPELKQRLLKVLKSRPPA